MKKKIFFAIAIVGVISTHAQTYNHYYGNIHAHTAYSDGNKDSATSMMSTPLQDFQYAKQSAHIDFYGISEHNHLQAGMKSPGDWHQGLLDANAVNQDSTFVAMYGMEFGVISNGGHVVIYGCDSLFGWDTNDYDVYVPEYDYHTLWNKINATPGAFATFAHPQTTDYDSIYFKPYDPLADSAVVGTAMRSGNAFSTTSSYNDPAATSYLARYKDALRLGYHVGASLDHDTHYSVFGRQTAGRTVVLAKALTRADIISAYKAMRFYSSDDWNVKVDFTITNHVMGSICSEAYNPVISVHVIDPDVAETVTSIKVYSGIPGSGIAPTLLTSVSNSSTLLYTAPLANLATNYYYLDITQGDTDRIWTSPIWYKRNDALAGIENYNSYKPNFAIYPNPNKGNFKIELDKNLGYLFTIEIFNSIGQLIYKESSNAEIDVNGLANGVYTVKLTTSEGVNTKRLIVEQ
ncbi:MAG: T9SS type A sorting domain-containing protein [Bacteroidia bacterium]